jgi:hypothetical protein
MNISLTIQRLFLLLLLDIHLAIKDNLSCFQVVFPVRKAAVGAVLAIAVIKIATSLCFEVIYHYIWGNWRNILRKWVSGLP